MEEQIFIEPPYTIPDNERDLKVFLQNIPHSPGVYKFLNKSHFPLYIGKAKSLNKRVSSYFRLSARSKKVDKLFEEVRFLEFSLTSTELESLLLEQFLIKESKPKYNVQFKDDKGYPWIKIDKSKNFPSAKSFLGKKQNNVKFYGPFPNSYAVSDALKLVQKTFKLRNCSDSYFKNRTRPCLQYEIGRCSGPCVNLISQKEYLKEVEGAELLLNGKSEELINKFYEVMDDFSSKKDYEKAAIYRDRISSLRDIQRSQSVAGFNASRDAIYLSSLTGKIKIGITRVRNGWVIGHQNFVKSQNSSESKVLESFIIQNYLSAKDCPASLIVGQNLKNKRLIEKALSKTHSKKIKIITKPSSKDKGLLDVCRVNTEYKIHGELKDRNINAKIDSLRYGLELQDNIKLIESYDISHHAGQDVVAGCVVYTSEGKAKDLYRHYNISEENAANDIGSMAELIKRRFLNKDVAPFPDLIIIDGGMTHLKNMLDIFKSHNFNNINVISISKGIRRKASFDTIHLPSGQSIPVNNELTFHNFIQEIRDETHRYALTLQKKKMAKSFITSSIDAVPGIGSVTKKNLLRYFGSSEQIRRANFYDLLKVKGVGEETAQKIINHFK